VAWGAVHGGDGNVAGGAEDSYLGALGPILLVSLQVDVLEAAPDDDRRSAIGSIISLKPSLSRKRTGFPSVVTILIIEETMDSSLVRYDIFLFFTLSCNWESPLLLHSLKMSACFNVKCRLKFVKYLPDILKPQTLHIDLFSSTINLKKIMNFFIFISSHFAKNIMLRTH